MRLGRTVHVLFALFVLSIFVVGCSSGSSENNDKKVTLKLASYHSTEDAVHKILIQPWMDKVEEYSDGNVEFKLYPAEQLGTADESYQLIQDGVAEVGLTAANYSSNQMPYSNMLAGFPGLNETGDQGTKAYRKLIEGNEEFVNTDFLKNGVRPLMIGVGPSYSLWSTDDPIRVPDDLKGRKTRAAGKVMTQLYDYLGASPVSVAGPELYESVDKGVVDSVGLLNLSVSVFALEDIVKYGNEMPAGTTITGLIINEDTWEGLPTEVQEWIERANKEMSEEFGLTYDEQTEKFNEEYEANGGTLIDLTDEEVNLWEEKYDEFKLNWIDKQEGDLSYQAVLDDYTDFLNED